MKILGVDPGINGAIAMIESDSMRLLELHDMPTMELQVGRSHRKKVHAQVLAQIIKMWEPDKVLIEQVNAMPGQGVASMFSFGRAAGIVEGVCAGMELPVTFITPQEWKRRMRVTGGKDGSRQRAAELYPQHSIQFARIKDDGRAEAVLIASCGGDI